MFLATLALLNAKALAYDKALSAGLQHYMMGIVQDRGQEYEGALKQYQDALRYDYGNPIIRSALAVTYFKLDNPSKAIEELNLAIKLDPEAVEPHAILALLYFSQDRLDEAGREYEFALKNASKLEPKNIDIYKNLGIIYLRKKQMELAEKTYELVAQLAPNDFEGHYYLATVYDRRGKRQDAVEELKRALELNPSYAEALNYLGYLYIEEGINLEEAKGMVLMAIEQEPQNGAYIDSLGWYYYKSGMYLEAVRELERAAALLQDPIVFDHLADSYYQINDLDNSRINWIRSLTLDPDQDSVREKLRKIEDIKNARRNKDQ